MAGSFHPSNVCWLLLWLQKTSEIITVVPILISSWVNFLGDWTSRAHKSDPPTSSGADMLHPADSRHSHGRHFAVRLHFYSAFLYSQQHLVCTEHTWKNENIQSIWIFLIIGLIRPTICSASYLLSLSFWLSPARRPQCSSATFIFVLRCCLPNISGYDSFNFKTNRVLFVSGLPLVVAIVPH